MQWQEEREGPWQSVLFFPKWFCFTSKRDRARGLWQERTYLSKQGPIFYPHAPSNVGHASACSALRGTHFINAYIEIRRNLWIALTSSAPAAHYWRAGWSPAGNGGGWWIIAGCRDVNRIASCVLLTWRRSEKGGKIKLELHQPYGFLQENFLCS